MPTTKDPDMSDPYANAGMDNPPAGPVEPILQFFTYAHLPEYLHEISSPFCELANFIHDSLPRNPERTVALRKLLEAKDAAVRAAIFKP